jgi:hypothetical protein
MTTSEPRAPRDQESWARPVDKLTTTAKGAGSDTVTGKRVAGPVQGFGQMWQKTFSVRLPGDEHAPEAVVAHWKEKFPTFWPKGATFYAPLSGIAPGEVALLEVPPVPGAPVKMSTGVMVIYADRESFTFMTPEGHIFAAWITFSAERDGDVDGATVAQVRALLRASDPLFEAMLMAGGHGQENRHWEGTLRNLAARFEATGTPTTEQVCVDRKRQWRQAGNIRHNAAIRSGLWTMTHPRSMLRRRGA